MLPQKVAGTLCLLVAGFAVLAVGQASSVIRIDTISGRFALNDFAFEVNPESRVAAIRLEYFYPPGRTMGDETFHDPQPRFATLPGLIYDPAAHAVVYRQGGKQTECAIQVTRHTLLGKQTQFKNTGACTAESRISHQIESHGWNTSRSDTLDTYFEVHRN